MAIDYGDYAKLYGGGVNLSPLMEGINQAIEKDKEARTLKVNNWLDGQWTDMMSPLSNAAFSEINTWDDSTFNMDYNTSFEDFKSGGEALGKKEHALITKAGHYNPTAFKQSYMQQLNSWMPQIERRIEGFWQQRHPNGRLWNDSMKRQFLNERPNLKKLINQYATNRSGEAYLMTLPTESFQDRVYGWADTARGIFGESAGDFVENNPISSLIGAGTGALATGYGAYKGVSALRNRGVDAVDDIADEVDTGPKNIKPSNQRDPFNIKKSDKILAELRERYDSIDGRTKAGKRLRNQIQRMTRFGESAVENADELLKSAGINPQGGLGKRLKNPSGWQDLFRGMGWSLAAYGGGDAIARNVAGALGAGEQGQEFAGKLSDNAINALVLKTNKIIKDKGLPYLLSQIAKKGGTGLALRLSAKLGLGVLGAAPTGGLATAAMWGWAAWDAAELANILSNIATGDDRGILEKSGLWE